MTTRLQTLEQARLCHQQGRFHVAADLLLQMFRIDPTDAEVARELGHVLYAAGDPDSAEDYLRLAWLADPNDSTTVSELLQLYTDLDRPQEATEVLLASLDSGLEPSELAMH